MRNNDLESIFKNKFKGHKESIDAQEMIQRLNLDQPKKKRKWIFFWWILIVSGIIISSLFLDSNFKDQFKNEEQVIRTSNKAEIQNDFFSNQRIKNEEIPEKVISESLNLQPVKNSNNENRLKTTAQTNIDLQQKNFSKLNVLNEENDQQNSPPNILNQLEKVIQKELIANNNPTSDLNNQLIKHKEISSLNKLYLDLNPNIQATLSDLITIVQENKIQSYLSFKAFTGVSFVSRTLSSSTDKYNDFINLRNQTEDQLEAIQFGISLSKSVNKYVYLNAGIEYTQINEKSVIKYTTNNLSIDNDFPVLLQIQSNGDTIINNGPAILNTPSFHTQTEYNNHKLISIPVHLGITKDLKKVQWFFDAGISANLYLGFFGNMHDLEENVTNSPSYFNPRIGFGYRLNTGFNYPISNHTKIGASFNYTNFITSVTDPDLMKQSYQLGGIRIGFMYKIK